MERLSHQCGVLGNREHLSGNGVYQDLCDYFRVARHPLAMNGERANYASREFTDLRGAGNERADK